MQIRIITIEREYGSGAAKIAQRLADQIGWKLWDELLTSEIARLAECDRSQVEQREERMDPLYYRLLKSILRGSFEGSLNVHRLNLLDADSIFRVTKRVVEEAALTGDCVIVGRGSQHFLRDREDTLRIFLYAPKHEKMRRLTADGVSPSEVEGLVDTVDSERGAFIQRYFQIEWPDRHAYHAFLNTALGDEIVIDTILSIKKAMEETH